MHLVELDAADVRDTGIVGLNWLCASYIMRAPTVCRVFKRFVVFVAAFVETNAISLPSHACVRACRANWRQ